MKTTVLMMVVLGLVGSSSCMQGNNHKHIDKEQIMTQEKMDTATFGAGCFWCVEALFQQLKGVHQVEPGFAGGHVTAPSYKEVCTGTTGHAEVCQIVYDPAVISYVELLEVFWKTHDPTTLDQQGADVGTQYRSVIFYHSEMQHQLAEEMKNKLDRAGIWKDPVVTEILPYEHFYKAEDYHQDYYFKNTSQPYCSAVITPKVEKFRKLFADQLQKK
jgi:peptide-methionine (S)-S-oxide reductase